MDFGEKIKWLTLLLLLSLYIYLKVSSSRNRLGTSNEAGTVTETLKFTTFGAINVSDIGAIVGLTGWLGTNDPSILLSVD